MNRMKYPLAVINQLFDQYSADIGLGYNIFCAFIKILMWSSLDVKTLPCICRESSLHFMAMPTTEGVRSNGIHCMWKVLGLKTLKNVNVHSINPMKLPLLLISQPLSISNNQLMNTFFFMTWDKHAASGKLFLSKIFCYNNLLGNFIFQNYHQALEWIQD